eukprot:TRINITY_DN6088_c0_g1_i1.p1 TRINITY_DN6088_c0_g1~~TRINITY_DN6088_c0_g1_i1.p1  ORF type:complete len:223 (-),score=39.69 TRINITY_DN6088_c0_g1_i1:19-687(-)
MGGSEIRQEVEDNIRRANYKVNELNSKVDLLDRFRESGSRQELVELIKSTEGLICLADASVTKFTKECRSQSDYASTRLRFGDDLLRLKNKFIQSTARAKEKLSNNPNVNVPIISQYNTHSNDQENEDAHTLQQRQKLTVLRDEINFQDEIIEEREKQIIQLEEQSIEVNQIMKEVLELIEGQEPMLRQIEQNIELTERSVDRALGEQRKALASSQSSCTIC